MRRVGHQLTRRASPDKFIRLVHILDAHVPADAPTAIIPITSLKGFQGLKVQGRTGGMGWAVELYGGNFYLVKVQGLEAVPLNTPLHVLNFLRSKLPKR